jgi:hypothetical protein
MAGDVVILDRCDYMYGVTSLRLRITRIAVLAAYPGWALVSGVPVGSSATGCEPVDAIVRVAALMARPPSSDTAAARAA